jgi:hypothetical protein
VLDVLDVRRRRKERPDLRPPASEAVALAEYHRVVLKALPLDQQDKAGRCLDASRHRDAAAARACQEMGPTTAVGRFEQRLLPGNDGDIGDFSDDGGMLPA